MKVWPCSLPSGVSFQKVRLVKAPVWCGESSSVSLRVMGCVATSRLIHILSITQKEG